MTHPLAPIARPAAVSVALLLGSIAPLAAQMAPSPEAAPAPAPPPAAAPSGEPPSLADRQRNNAAKLAGMIRFVASACPDAQPDYDRFKSVIAGMRVDIKDLENGPLLATSLGYSRAYERDGAESCRRAFEHFGQSGTTIPGLIAKKAPQEAPPAPAPAPDAPAK